jgi:glutathione S-transferase
MRPTLVIGNRNYSSWSLRAWLGLRCAGIDFDEMLVRLSEPGSRDELARHSPTGRVPVLHADGVAIAESLAILEWAAERAPTAGLWPADPAARAVARSVAAEMHAGFATLRATMPMNLRRHLPLMVDSAIVADDLARITVLLRDCRLRFGSGGPFLFGERPGAADAMYLPVATRFRTYAVALDQVSQAWVDAILDLPQFKEWEEAAQAEPWIIPEDEVA